MIKSFADLDRTEPCVSCSSIQTAREIGRTHFYGASDWNNQGFDPALGTYVRGDQHRRQIAKERGLEEIGNEPVHKVHAHFEAEKKRQLDATWSKI